MPNNIILDLLAHLLLEISDGERKIEIIRQILCEQEEFEPYAAFRRIDRTHKGHLEAEDIHNFLKDNDLNYEVKQCLAFIRRYDVDGDDKLNYSEFLKSVLTASNPVLRAVTSQRPNYDIAVDQYLLYDVEYSLARLIDRELTFYLDLDPKKISICSRPDFSLSGSFFEIDILRSGMFDFKSLKAFFTQRQLEPYDEELFCIVRRIDKKGDGYITYADFVEAIEPLDLTSRPIIKSEPKKLTKSPVLAERSKDSANRLTFNRENLDRSPHDSKSSSKQTSPSTKKSTTPLKPRKGTQNNSKSPSKVTNKSLFNSQSPRQHASDKKVTTSTNSSTRLFETKPVSPGEFNDDTFNQKAIQSAQKIVNKNLFSSEKKLPNSTSRSPVNSTRSPNHLVRSNGKGSGSKNASPSPSMNVEKFSPQMPKKYLHSPVLSKNTCNSTINILNKSISPKIKKSASKKAVLEEKPHKLNPFQRYNLLVSGLKTFISLEKELEVCKQDLSLRPDFNLFDYFRFFDKSDRGTVSSIEIIEGMKDFEIFANREEIALLIARYDVDCDGILNEAFTPKQFEYATLLSNRMPINADGHIPLNQMFSAETRKQITRVIKLTLDNEVTSESLRQKFVHAQMFTNQEGFYYLDHDNDGFITFDDLKDIFDKHEVLVTDKEIKLLLERFNVSKEGRVSYTEFSKEMAPKSKEKF